jgi:hypothetical protein
VTEKEHREKTNDLTKEKDGCEDWRSVEHALDCAGRRRCAVAIMICVAKDMEFYRSRQYTLHAYERVMEGPFSKCCMQTEYTMSEVRPDPSMLQSELLSRLQVTLPLTESGRRTQDLDGLNVILCGTLHYTRDIPMPSILPNVEAKARCRPGRQEHLRKKYRGRV